VKVAFLVNDLQLSGGVGVVVEHARQLARHHGFDSSIVLVREQEAPSWGYTSLPEVSVLTLDEARREHFDVAVATWWETTFALFHVPAERYAYFVQSLEDRFYQREEAGRLGAALTLDLPVAFITEATWIADTLAQLRPDAPVHLVRNGIDKDVFAPVDHVEPHLDGPLRVLIEGHPSVWFKGIAESIASVRAMSEPHHLTLVTGFREDLRDDADVDEVLGPLSQREMAAAYRRSHVILKLSRVEGMYGPPLEAFHQGATAVTTPVTGHDEYVVNGWNGLVTEWDDVAGTARRLDLLARDGRLLQFLRHNALATARAWPSWDQSAQLMAMALHRVRHEDAPPATTTAAAMLADLRGGIETYHGHLAERAEFLRAVQRAERVKALPGIRQARGVWRSERVQRSVGPTVIKTAKKLLRR
jgi:glycosyltransferase involved in cell wall biosynthesis